MKELYLNDSMENLESGKRMYRFAPVKRVAKANLSPLPDIGLRGNPAGKRMYRFAPVKRVAKANLSPLPDIGLRGYPAEMYDRRVDAVDLRFCREEGGCTGEKKICISAHGIQQWHENLYGFPRVVVHGVDSLCVVARTKDLEDVNQSIKPKRCVTSLKKALIYEAEDLALPSDEELKMSSRTFKKPFVAVSVVSGTISGHEALGDEYDVDRAIMFLKEQMASGTKFNFEKSVKTAILTLQHLFGTKFEAKEIRVFYVKKHIGRVVGGDGRSDKAVEFPTRAERSIMDYLAVLNKPHSKADEFPIRSERSIMNHLASRKVAASPPGESGGSM